MIITSQLASSNTALQNTKTPAKNASPTTASDVPASATSSIDQETLDAIANANTAAATPAIQNGNEADQILGSIRMGMTQQPAMALGAQANLDPASVLQLLEPSS